MSLRRVLNNTILKSTKYQIVKEDPILKKHKESVLSLDLEFIVTHKLISSNDFFFIQIGANDGIGNDAIHPLVKKYKIRGVVLEPLPDIFAILQKNYADEKQITCVNKAIHNELKETQLYRIDSLTDLSGLPVWATRIASFDKRVIESHRKHIPDIDKRLIHETVQCVSLDELLVDQNVQHVDLLQIDAEGYDYEIIKMINFQKVKPSIIRYEYKHLSRQDFAACLEYLIQNGYRILHEDSDITAYLR
ncbi:MAG: FkbM family methyltransferase [Proteobacteria bacterium]|nr:FkbM family methyltransferase [Pseudomonadota bacterium]